MAQQLPRCWMIRVWSSVGGGSRGGGGQGSVSIRGFSNFAEVGQVGTARPVHRAFGSPPRSRALLILSRSSSSSSAHRNLRLAVSSGDRFRAGSGKNFADGCGVSGTGLRTSRLPLLSPFVTRGLSSAEAQAVADGFVKDSPVKEAEEKEKSGSASAAAVGEGEETGLLTETDLLLGEEAGVFLEEVSSGVAVEKETDELSERVTLIAEIRSKELELAELRSALRLVEEKQGVVVDSAVASGFPEVDVSAEHAAASQVSAALQESDHGYGSVTDAESEEEGDVATSNTEGVEDEVGGEEKVDVEPVAHPWPEWIRFLKRLDQGRHFMNEENEVVDMNGISNDDVGQIKRACLNFARERDDIFLRYARKDLEVIARFGCPSTDRKVVNAGKRLRDFLAIDEISICKPCALRSSCERRDFKANADHVSGTPEVIRLLSQYALEVSPYAKEGLQIPSAVQAACQSLLRETVALAAVKRDPNLPRVERKEASPIKSDRRERDSKRRTRDADVEMKPGDWKCEECQYVNFARNRTCRECDAFRPVPEMRPGDWRCPECNFLNFSRNQECHDCQVARPAGAGHRSSYDTGSRYEREAPPDRGSRFDRERRPEVRRGGERESSYGRSRELGGLEGRSGSGESRIGRRSNFEEWKPDLKKRGDFDEDERRDRRPAPDRRAALDVVDDEDDDEDDDGLDEFDLDSDEDISDVEPLEDEEFEDMRPVASATRGRSDPRRSDELRSSRGAGRNEDKVDSGWEDDRGYRSERSDRGSRAGGDGGRSRGRGRGGGRGGRGDFGRDRGSSRDPRPSSYERSDRDSGRSYERSDRDSGRSYGRSDRDYERPSSDRPSRGRGGGRGGGGRGGGRGRGRR